MTVFGDQRIKAGFTLLEVIVVVTLIGVLAAAGMSVFSEVRQQARDERRAADLRQLQIAIEAYKDAYGVYPDPGCGSTKPWTGPGPFISVTWGQTCEDYIDGLAPEFIAELPRDPINEYEEAEGFIYRTNTSRDSYKVIVAPVETEEIESYEDTLARCPRSCLAEYPGNNYCNATPGQNPQPLTYAVYAGEEGKCW